MKVYVLETGCYENRYVSGIYDSPERAMAAADGKWTKTTWNIGVPKSGEEWHDRPRVSWDNDLDWDSAASVSEFDLEEDGPLLTDYRVREQRYRASDGGWDYVVT